MAIAVPLLDVYYIEFTKNRKEEPVSTALTNGNPATNINALLPRVANWIRFAAFPFLALDVSLTPKIIKSLIRFVEDNRFYLIRSLDELNEFENANGNEWIINDKALKQKQYYIRHPKKLSRNLLIEAKAFYDYIEEEQKDELIDYILSHCPVKHIQIDRFEAVQAEGKAKANLDGIDGYGNMNFGLTKGNYYSFSNPKGTTRTQPRENYYWIDKSLMRGIAALEEGGSLDQTYESDLTFGLSLGEAKTIGLDLSKHKKFSYKIHIEC